MADFVALTCPTCGGKLQITSDIDRFACGHCGNEHVVRRSGGTISLAAVTEGLAKVQTGVDKTAAELAIKRLGEELEDLRKEKERVVEEWNEKIKSEERRLANKTSEKVLLEAERGKFRRGCLAAFSPLVLATLLGTLSSFFSSGKLYDSPIELWFFVSASIVSVICLGLIKFGIDFLYKGKLEKMSLEFKKIEQETQKNLPRLRKDMSTQLKNLDDKLLYKRQEINKNFKIASS